LFPTTDRAIPFQGQNQVRKDFERIEHEKTGEGNQGKYLALAESLEKVVK
jgi:hemerythrin-like domain-containing protein